MATLLPPPSVLAPLTSPRDKTMASRRVPLGNLPNAANSPFREATAPGTKRPRAADAAFEKQHPAKKQVVEAPAEDVENRRVAAGRKAQTATAAPAPPSTCATSRYDPPPTLQLFGASCPPIVPLPASAEAFLRCL